MGITLLIIQTFAIKLMENVHVKRIMMTELVTFAKMNIMIILVALTAHVGQITLLIILTFAIKLMENVHVRINMMVEPVITAVMSILTFLNAMKVTATKT